jgi:xanthine/uracil permease
MNLKYGLEGRPPFKENLVYGLQWLAVTIPAVIILGKVLGGMQGSIEAELLYMQKLFAVMAVSLLLQIKWGHRLPLVIGPATVLLIGILAAQDSSPAAIYSSILICGLVLTFLAASGLFAYLRRFFTPSVVVSFPSHLRPILANGFVIGVLVSLLLENVIYRLEKN